MSRSLQNERAAISAALRNWWITSRSVDETTRC